MKRFLKLLFVLSAVYGVSGCYLPTDYDLRVQILNDGRYAFEYEGDVVHVGFLQRLGWKKMLEEGREPSEYVEETWANMNLDRDDILDYDEDKRAGIYKRDLERDRGFEAVEYQGQARYNVKYRYQGNIRKQKSFTFVRRNGWFMRIARTAPGVVELKGNSLPSNHEDALIEGGFDSYGTVRVWTDANVVSHNATSVQQGSPSLYRWDIRSMKDPTPSMVIGIGASG